MTMEESFWNDKRSSSAVIKEMNEEKEIIAEFKKLESEVGEEEVLIDFVEIKFLAEQVEAYQENI